ncbi:ribonuclease H-like domain-containing protein [Tanacetum coccineum]
MSEAEPIPPTSSVTALRIPMIKKAPKTSLAANARRNNEKALNILLSAIPDRHLLSFHDATNAKTLWTAIKARFGGNEASKKMQKNLLKQQFETFTIGSREELDSAYERFQNILSMLELYDAKVSLEDANLKFLRSLPSVWHVVATMIRGQPGLDELEFDDLYNNLKVYEHELKGVSNSSSQNIAFLSTEVKGSTLKQSTADPANIPKGYTQATSSKVQTAPNCASHSDEIICSFFAQQASMPTTHDDEDLLQIDEDAMEEIDIRWQVAMITARIRKFMRKTGRPIDLKPKNGITFDKSKIECFNCQKLGQLGMFDGKSEEGYLLGYSTNSKGFRVYNRVTRKVQDCLHVDFLENQENQRGKGPDWMFDLELLSPSMNYIPVRKENYADSGEKVSTYDDVEDLDDQQFIVHGPSINTVQHKHSEERTADKEVPLSSDEQALHDELVNLMHQESLAKLHNDAQRNAFEEEKRRIALEKGKECANSTLTLSTANTPSQSTGNTPTDSDDDVPKDGVFSTNSFDDENTDTEEGGAADYNNMDPTIDVTSTPTLRIHKIHPQSQIIGKSTAGILTRRKLKESASDQHQALLSFIYKQNRLTHKDQQTYGKRVIGTKWVFRNKRDERGFEDPAHPTRSTELSRHFMAYIKPQEHGTLTSPKLGLWYPKDSPFHLEAFSDSDYAGDNHDRRSTSGGCQYLGRRLVSWQCKKKQLWLFIYRGSIWSSSKLL